MKKFDASTLPNAIRTLFELNHYRVEGPLKIHGAEVDLVARPSDPFGVPIYIEATIEHVDNDKYGKDVGKLAMIGELERDAQRLIVSSEGFSLPVKERAAATRILTLTYDELFRKFQRFERYIDWCIGTGDYAQDLAKLAAIYEEPSFEDKLGKDLATTYLANWLKTADRAQGWLVVTGEYGTGKTALTKVLQYRWLQDYKLDPSLPLPIRIELRNFTKQFDAKGLIHHFLDHNHLAHVPADFLYSLIRGGRVVLLLDGYDEMAQYLHARERRACLEALAELSTGGARGILTSRPNYFTETEELQVFEVLYSSLKHAQYTMTGDGAALLAREQRVDSLLQQFIDRFERVLRDLTREQTEALIGRVLKDDPIGRDAVLRVLSQVFRTLEAGDAVSLSGKPVIINYLLQVVEGLKQAASSSSSSGLTEAQTYSLIVDQLMLRDFGRTPELGPDTRRGFLHKLAIFLSSREHATIDSDDFKDLVTHEFKRDFARLSGETRTAQLERYFMDLRTSATLTSSSDRTKDGWRFSHNSLREYLAFEYLLRRLLAGDFLQTTIPITDAMRAFAASLTRDEKARYLLALAQGWKQHTEDGGRGQLLCLLFDAVLSSFPAPDSRGACLAAIAGTPVALNSVRISRLTLSTENTPAQLSDASFVASTLADVDLTAAQLAGSNFNNAALEAVKFTNSTLTGASFAGAFLVDVDVSGADLKDCDFRGVDTSDISILTESQMSSTARTRFQGVDALGYLQFNGARTDEIPQFAVLRHHPKFAIIEKIMTKLEEQRIRQRRGLEQRGAAQDDIPFARKFLQFLEGKGWLAPGRRDTVEVTESGRSVFAQFVSGKRLVADIVDFMRQEG